MIHTLIGPDRFRRGMDLYFQRYAGRAVTIEDFLDVMGDAGGRDLSQFRRWYEQAGTPEVRVRGEYDEAQRTFALTLEQQTPPTPGQTEKLPLHVPIRTALLDPEGREMPLHLASRPPGGATEVVVELTEPMKSLRFNDVPARPVMSIGRGFSAPVKLEVERSDAELAFLLAHNQDAFGRWDAAQDLATRRLERALQDWGAGAPASLCDAFTHGLRRTLDDETLDEALVAEILRLPDESYLADWVDEFVPEAIHDVRQQMRLALAEALEAPLRARYRRCASVEPYRYDARATARRSLKNACLSYLVLLGDKASIALCKRQFDDADNMTDGFAALASLVDSDSREGARAIDQFEIRWGHDPLVMDKWFSLQARSRRSDTLDNVIRLVDHPGFDVRNPNRVRSLLGAFGYGNPVRFHDHSGRAYEFLADRILEIDPLNPQTAARLVGVFSRWTRLEPIRKALAKATLERIVATPRGVEGHLRGRVENPRIAACRVWAESPNLTGTETTAPENESDPIGPNSAIRLRR